jgi:hypothetical protein
MQKGGGRELSCRCCTDSDWICSAFRCGSRRTATLWPIGGCKRKGGINPPYYICEKTGTKGMACCKEIWMTQMTLKLKLKSYKISDGQPCVCLESIVVPKCYTTLRLSGSGSRLPSALNRNRNRNRNRNLPRTPEIRTYKGTGDCMMYSGDSFQLDIYIFLTISRRVW